MRLIHALLDAMRIRRTRRIGLTEADRWVVGDRPGPDHQGLAELLSAARAPASADELAGEQAAVAAFAAAHRRAASLERRSRVRVSRRATMVVVNTAAGLALIAVAGTAVAARTGNLPDGAQQHAHRVFSALGVPAPRTSPPGPAPTSAPPVGTPKTTSRPSPTPTPVGSTASRAETVPAGWCRAWSAAPHDSRAAWRSKLIEAAGSDEGIAAYCAAVNVSTKPGSGTSTASERGPSKPSRSTKSHGKPGTLPTPDHHGKPSDQPLRKP
jgi:hypothetical protein